MLEAVPATPNTADAAPARSRRRGGQPRPERERRPLRDRLRFPIITSLIVQVVLVLGDRMPGVDALTYFETGRNWVEGNGYTRHGAPEMHFPPVAPISYGLLESALGSDVYAMRAWNLIWGLAFVALITFIAWFLSRDDDVVVGTLWFATFVPGVVTLSIRAGAGSEIASVTLLLGAVLAVLLALDRAKDRGWLARLGGLVGAGTLVALSYLTRPEFLLPGAVLGLGVIAFGLTDRQRPLAARLGRTAAHAAAFGFTTLLVIAPYVSYQHRNTGSWSLTSKTKDASIDAWRAVAQDDRLERDQILYAIQPDGTSLGPETVSLTELAKEHPRGWMTIGWINATTIFKFYAGAPFQHGPVWDLIPLFLLVPAFAKIWGNRRNANAALFAAVGAVPLLTCFLFFALPRYLMLTSAVLIPFGVWGLVEWMRRVKRPHRTWGWLAIGVLTAASFLVASANLLPFSPTAERTEQRTAGLWLKENTPEDARIMTRSFHVQGYSEREVVAFPYADYLGMLDFANRMGVDYIVADETTIKKRRPELYDILMREEGAPPGLELAHEFTERGQTVKIYRLVPESPVTDQPPLWLGYVSD